MEKKSLVSVLIALVMTAVLPDLSAAVKPARIFSDNMVLQRDKPLKIWGWADAGESIRIEFNGQTVKAKANKAGAWLVELKPMTHGGPFQMVIAGKSDKVTLQNVLIGDVWLGSGQSNMEWVMTHTENAQKEIAAANYPKIRLFTVEKRISYSPEQDISGGPWLECSPKTVAFFSAVAYYFGRKLHEEIEVPIGLINSSWGGTKVEPWISWEMIQFEADYRDIKPEDHAKIAAKNKENATRFEQAIKDDLGTKEKWFDTNVAATGWETIKIAGEGGSAALANADGVVWYRKEIDISRPGGSWQLSLGPIDDADVTYINGTKVGGMPIWNQERLYNVPDGLLKAGKNTIAIKVTDHQGGGGLTGKAEQLHLTNGKEKISLTGDWLFRAAALTTEYGIKDVGPNSFGAVLYNGMIAPLVKFPIRGVIWYQGESNTYAAYKYRRLFPTLIKDWRSKWGYEFPFFWVQLANFMKTAEVPSESEWAELREAQHKTLSVSKTGEAVVIDIGDADDIHPRNKKDVGIRLALRALHLDYGKDVAYSGPEFKEMKVDGSRVLLSFDFVHDGLVAKNDRYGYVRGFAIAGADRKFRWAKAYIKENKVIVYHDDVPNPVAVRYAWSDNPGDANLYNSADLPASPFRTDEWPLTTEARGK